MCLCSRLSEYRVFVARYVRKRTIDGRETVGRWSRTNNPLGFTVAEQKGPLQGSRLTLPLPLPLLPSVHPRLPIQRSRTKVRERKRQLQVSPLFPSPYACHVEGGERVARANGNACVRASHTSIISVRLGTGAEWERERKSEMTLISGVIFISKVQLRKAREKCTKCLKYRKTHDD